MDNSNNITNTLFKSDQGSILSSSNGVSSVDGSTTSDGGIFGFFQNITATTWIIIILILAFLGFNVFVYLAKGTQDITNLFGPIVNKIFGTTIDVTGQVIDVSAEGAKAVVSETAGAINTGLTGVQTITPGGVNATSSVKGQTIQQQVEGPNFPNTTSSLNKALSSSQQQNEYQAVEASSTVHSGAQSGWCYIGEERGVRTCFEVGANDTCMSGDIFPTQEVCINPSLRA